MMFIFIATILLFHPIEIRWHIRKMKMVSVVRSVLITALQSTIIVLVIKCRCFSLRCVRLKAANRKRTERWKVLELNGFWAFYERFKVADNLSWMPSLSIQLLFSSFFSVVFCSLIYWRQHNCTVHCYWYWIYFFMATFVWRQRKLEGCSLKWMIAFKMPWNRRIPHDFNQRTHKQFKVTKMNSVNVIYSVHLWNS